MLDVFAIMLRTFGVQVGAVLLGGTIRVYLWRLSRIYTLVHVVVAQVHRAIGVHSLWYVEILYSAPACLAAST